jgi:hypothetical protein
LGQLIAACVRQLQAIDDAGICGDHGAPFGAFTQTGGFSSFFSQSL